MIFVIGFSFYYFLTFESRNDLRECEKFLTQGNFSYLICPKINGKTRTIYYPYDSYLFYPNFFIIFEVNPMKISSPFDSFYLCIYSNISLSDKKETFKCTPKILKGEYFPLEITGYVTSPKGESGKIIVYVFDGNLSSNFDFRSNLDKGIEAIKINVMVGN
jgi:hypothetical protein